MKKLTRKTLSNSAEVILEIALTSLGLASNFGTYQEKEPTEMLERMKALKDADKQMS